MANLGPGPALKHQILGLGPINDLADKHPGGSDSGVSGIPTVKSRRGKITPSICRFQGNLSMSLAGLWQKWKADPRIHVGMPGIPSARAILRKHRFGTLTLPDFKMTSS